MLLLEAITLQNVPSAARHLLAQAACLGGVCSPSG